MVKRRYMRKIMDKDAFIDKWEDRAKEAGIGYSDIVFLIEDRCFKSYWHAYTLDREPIPGSYYIKNFEDIDEVELLLLEKCDKWFNQGELVDHPDDFMSGMYTTWTSYSTTTTTIYDETKEVNYAAARPDKKFKHVGCKCKYSGY